MSERPPPPLLGLVVLAMASGGYLAATGVLPSDDSDFGAPRWVVAWIVVVCFWLPGLMILAGGSSDSPRIALLGRILAPLIATGLAAHAFDHGLSRSGAVQLAWFLLAGLVAWVAGHYWMKLVGHLERRE